MWSVQMQEGEVGQWQWLCAPSLATRRYWSPAAGGSFISKSQKKVLANSGEKAANALMSTQIQSGSFHNNRANCFQLEKGRLKNRSCKYNQTHFPHGWNSKQKPWIQHSLKQRAVFSDDVNKDFGKYFRKFKGFLWLVASYESAGFFSTDTRTHNRDGRNGWM